MNRSFWIVTALATSLAIAHPVVAQDVNCLDPQTQFAMNICAAQDYAIADEDLNLAYQLARNHAQGMDQYLNSGDRPAVEILRDAQRAWIAYRDMACETESLLARGGSMQPLLFTSCAARLTRLRTEDLRYFGEVN